MVCLYVDRITISQPRPRAAGPTEPAACRLSLREDPRLNLVIVHQRIRDFHLQDLQCYVSTSWHAYIISARRSTGHRFLAYGAVFRPRMCAMLRLSFTTIHRKESYHLGLHTVANGLDLLADMRQAHVQRPTHRAHHQLAAIAGLAAYAGTSRALYRAICIQRG